MITVLFYWIRIENLSLYNWLAFQGCYEVPSVRLATTRSALSVFCVKASRLLGNQHFTLQFRFYCNCFYWLSPLRFDLPPTLQFYHRLGRTATASASASAVYFQQFDKDKGRFELAFYFDHRLQPNYQFKLGTYIDKKCPFTGHVSIRGRIIAGTCHSAKMNRTIIVRRNYLHYVRKYQRYEKRHSNIPAHVSPRFRVKEGDHVIIGQCRFMGVQKCLNRMRWWVLERST